jgi:hypothetical protein
MTRTIPKTCDCCGIAFMAGSPIARWCNDRCALRAFHRRRRGQPEADPALAARTKAARAQVMQPQLLAAPAYQAPTRAMVELEVESRSWQGTPIQRRQADGFVNATQMAKANGKHLPHYMANERTQAYIAALAPVVGIPTTELVSVRQGGQPHLQGTWIHPRLAVDLARWISPAFAVWMDGWFLETIAGRPPAAPAIAPAAPGITVTARTEREAWGIWLAAIEAEALGAIRTQLGVAGRPDSVIRKQASAARWRFAPC